MNVTVFSFVMSALFSTLFILGIHLIRDRAFFLYSFGVHTILGLYALCLFRTVVLLELPFTVPVGLRNVYSDAFEAVWSAHIPIGDSSVRLLFAICGVWAVASATLVTQFLWTKCRTARKADWYSVNRDAYIERVLEQVKSESWRRPKVSVCICPTLDVPMGIGLFRHRIILPEQEYAREELYYILKHEYTHFCNRDLTVKFLVNLFCCIFWWNPAVYLLKKDISQILEIKCDLRATESFSKKEKLEYLLTIVRVLKGPGSSGNTPPMLATGLGRRDDDDDMRERFRVITAVPRPVSGLCKGAFWALAVTIVVLSYSFVLQPAFAPPVEDIYSNGSVEEVSFDDIYLIQRKDGQFLIVLDNGDIHSLSKTAAQVYIDAGAIIKKE